MISLNSPNILNISLHKLTILALFYPQYFLLLQEYIKNIERG